VTRKQTKTKMVKLSDDAHALLVQVAGIRQEELGDCVHNLLVEELRRGTLQKLLNDAANKAQLIPKKGEGNKAEDE